MSLFSTPSPPSKAGGTGPAGGRPDFPSPTKLVRNGLTGTELGAQMAADNLLKLSKQRGLTYSGKREEVVTFDYVVTNKFVTVFGDGAERLLHLNGKDGYSFSEWTNMGECGSAPTFMHAALPACILLANLRRAAHRARR